MKIQKRESNRMPARRRYKIEKKVRQHNKKMRRADKKNPAKKKQPIINVPNHCPFKEDILKEVEALKKQKEEEKQKQRDLAKLERQKKKEESKAGQSLEGLVVNAEARGKVHDTLMPDSEQLSELNKNQENSLKAYYKEFKKVIDAADVILEVVDCRDPMGTRCMQVEKAVQEATGNKRLVIVLNKADLVPRENLDKWLKYIRKTTPAVPFKASTQNQSKKLGHKKMGKSTSANAIQGSACIGAELLMSVLANYCRNKGIKTSIRVGVVGLPNVGKSSLINSLKRSRACNVGATPGVTRAMQEVQLDSKIKLLDSPGIVFATGNDSSASLRNAVKVSAIADPITPANAILQRVNKKQMMEMYDIVDYTSPDEFYNLKARSMGRFKRGGIPDMVAAARGLLEDWNNGKIKYYTIPPEEEPNVHISAAIVKQVAKEFNVDEFEVMETEMLGKFEDKKYDGHLVKSLGMLDDVVEEKMEDDNKEEDELLKSKVVAAKKVNKKKGEARMKKQDPEMELEGNLKLNKIKKMEFKKAKKQKNRKEKVEHQLSTGLESFSIKGNDDYDFEVDHSME
ncbi:PREDICTED: guanine nucleotide-binding protein-like 3 homolog [Nicrophorus vespilloides]|uniref:Guanine nucleotide-binding protein-like 3 homolog n=1 Tax=Nicrophorus vespilloides TaxID=110193 RepID=A0ABM1NCN4_NICVS|nr:PREDICTED: guanine nucleotide-binding protein-like 3 homolog [Nicrophorus vespilloides]